MTAPTANGTRLSRRLPSPARRLVARRLPSPVRRLPAVLIAALLAVALVAGVLALSGGPAPAGPPDVTPLRVTSGTEIATGFAVGDDRVVTVAHVLGRTLTVEGRRARVLRVDRRSDLALLAAPGVGGSVPSLAEVGGGQRVRVLRLRSGRSTSLSVRVRRAIVAHVRGPEAERAATRPALELAARVVGGDSGAPVVSRSGALAGVVFAASSRRPEIAYAVDASAVGRLLARD
jgi:hypothetical protein